MVIRDAPCQQVGLDDVGAAAVPGGVDAAVVGEQGCGVSPLLSGSREDPEHVGRPHHRHRLARHDETRVVVEEVQDLDLRPVREAPVRDVRLPAFVG